MGAVERQLGGGRLALVMCGCCLRLSHLIVILLLAAFPCLLLLLLLNNAPLNHRMDTTRRNQLYC